MTTSAAFLKRRQINRRLGLLVASALLSASCFSQTPAASASTYPNKPVRLIVGFPAGTGPDIVAPAGAKIV